jgi:hypothetical protein
MTLDITLASRWLMVQSTDFRLTVLGRKDPWSEAAQKQVVLHYQQWSGLLCYTGVAGWRSHDTAKWLEQVLTHQHAERSAQEVVTKIATEGNKWLATVPIQNRRHTFTLIAYIRRVPHVYVISNCQWAGGRMFPQPLAEFKVDPLRPLGPRCLVTGWTSAVTQSQREQLESQLAANLPPATLRYAVATASRDAACRSQGTVGENCVVAHLLPDGSGEAQVFGHLSSAFLPTLITHGANAASFAPDVFSAAGATGPHRLVGVTWTANGPTTGMLAAYRAPTNQTSTGRPTPPAAN